MARGHLEVNLVPARGAGGNLVAAARPAAPRSAWPAAAAASGAAHWPGAARDRACKALMARRRAHGGQILRGDLHQHRLGLRGMAGAAGKGVAKLRKRLPPARAADGRGCGCGYSARRCCSGRRQRQCRCCTSHSRNIGRRHLQQRAVKHHAARARNCAAWPTGPADRRPGSAPAAAFPPGHRHAAPSSTPCIALRMSPAAASAA